METPAESKGFTVIVISLEVAGFPDVQVSLDVSWQVMTSSSERPELAKVGLFEPTLFPFTFH
jgi:hypothetical protein